MSDLKNERIEYFIKRPDEQGRASFSIVKRTKKNNQKPRHEVVKFEAVVKINNAYKAQIIDRDTACFQLTQICKSLNDEVKKLGANKFEASNSNMKLLEQYWEAVYKRRKIKRRDSARYRLEWGLKIIGSYPLLGKIDELQTIIDGKCADDRRKQRRACSIINQMRRWFGLADRLQLERKTLPDFRYHTADEFLLVIKNFEVGDQSVVSAATYRSLFRLLFYSGVRTGEAFALRKDNYSGGNSLKVLTQLDRDEVETETKNGEIRTAYLFKDAIADFRLFVAAKDKKQICRNSLARIFRRACKKTFPNDPSKWITVHDLRHSYAVMLMTKYDISISQIAKLLGNSFQVCEQYYLRFVKNDDLIDSISRKICKVHAE